MKDVRPEDVLVAGEPYRIRYKDPLEASGEGVFVGEFARYVEADDLCIFFEDNAARTARAVVWSTEMIEVDILNPDLEVPAVE